MPAAIGLATVGLGAIWKDEHSLEWNVRHHCHSNSEQSTLHLCAAPVDVYGLVFFWR